MFVCQTAHIQTYLSTTACFRMAYRVIWPSYGSFTNGAISPQKDEILFSVNIGRRAVTALRGFLLREELFFKSPLRTWKTQRGESVQMSFWSGCGQDPQGTTQKHSQGVGADWMSWYGYRTQIHWELSTPCSANISGLKGIVMSMEPRVQTSYSFQATIWYQCSYTLSSSR